MGIEQEQFCDRHHFIQLYRHAVAMRRESRTPAGRDVLHRFLQQWHQVGECRTTAVDLLTKYSGYAFSPMMLEQSLFLSRSADGADLETSFKDSILSGGIIVRAIPVSESGSLALTFFLRGQGNALIDRDDVDFPGHVLEIPNKERMEKIYYFLKENGASLFQDIIDGTGLTTDQADEGISFLCGKGFISCNDYQALLMVIRHQKNTARMDTPAPQVGYTAFSRRHLAAEKLGRHRGYWFLVNSFAMMGKPLDENQRAEKQARLLLQRYGLLVKEWYRYEQGLLPWYRIFQVLKRLEWQGEIRRGYFVKGLSGLQFATAEAVDLLEKMHNPNEHKERRLIALSTVDPALPFGGQVSWDLVDAAGDKLMVVRSLANHVLFFQGKPVLYSENYGTRLWQCVEFSAEWIRLLPELIKEWLRLSPLARPRRKIVISLIDGQDAVQSSLAEELLKNGFEKDGEKLVLWPSRV
jgi:hypothetical protein